MDGDKKKSSLPIKIIVISLGLLVFIIWFFNLKNVWLVSKPVNNEEFASLKNNFSQTMSELKDKLNQTKIDNAKQEKIKGDIFIKELIKEAENLASSTKLESEKGSSTSPVQLKQENKNCPQYINCMPTIGEARNCAIPPGCEGSTTLLY